MAIITNIPQAMIDEHIAWHSRPGNPTAGGRAIDPFPPFGSTPAAGSGEEFLVWHSGFLSRFLDWVDNLPTAQKPTSSSIAAWTAIPQMLKMSMLGWNATLANEESQLSDMSNFGSLDDLGQFLEWSLHGFLHNAASGMWSEPMLLSFESPRSTYFWQLHGLIDHWRDQWVNPPVIVNPTIGGGTVQVAIGTPGEVDTYQFNVANTSNLKTETSGPSDTVLYVAGPDDAGVLHSSDDDGGDGFNSKIEASFDPGDYVIYVVLYDRSRVGQYGISIE